MRKSPTRQACRKSIYEGWMLAHPDSHEFHPHRTYERTWEEIENMLDQATEKMHQWKEWYEMCKSEKDKDGMKRPLAITKPRGCGKDPEMDPR